ncbi:MAG: DUF58 domain-containing protein [Thermodesulfobacteriota bacterium]
MSFLNLGKDNWIRTSPTKEGVIFIILSFIVGFSALNTNNNLLYLIFGVMISLVILSGVISMINLSKIDVKLSRTPDLYALTPSEIVFSLTNQKPLIPSLSLTLEMNDNKTYLLYLPAHSTRSVGISCFFNSRGWNNFPILNLYTRFPFGFFKKLIKVELQNKKVLVFPNIHNVNLDINTETDYSGEDKAIKKGQSEELKSIRDYGSGDNVRDIDWKTTAKLNKLMVKEFFDNETKSVKIVFEPQSINLKNLEHYISEKASLLNEYIKLGFSVDFITSNKIYKTICNKNQMNKVLTFLALYEE